MLVHAFMRVVVEGTGTPTSVAPTATVVYGPYYVRGPMYLAVAATTIGQT